MLHEPTCNLVSQLLRAASGSELQELERMISSEKSTREELLTPEELQLLRGGDKIGTIRSVRHRTNMGLKEAKDFVDRVVI